jgi:CHAD domain-containing protein
LSFISINYNQGFLRSVYIMSAAPDRYTLLRSRLDRFTRLLPGVEKGDIRAIHRARVATRRLRELLPVLELDASASRKLGRRLRRLTKRLGVIRELDVLLLLVNDLQESSQLRGRALGRVAGDLRRKRESAGREFHPDAVVPELQRVARKLRDVADDLKDTEKKAERRSDERAWQWAIDARVARRAGNFKEALEHAGSLYLPDRLHRVRIALKKLRYAAEVDAEVARIERSADILAMKHAQESLGRLHDLQVLIDRVRKTQASLDPPDIGVWRDLDGLTVALEQRCRRLHARYVRQRPELDQICDRMLTRGAKTPARRERRTASITPAARVSRAG